MARVPGSLADAISEDPNRFLKYLNLKKIAAAKDPMKEFKRQLQQKFGSTTTGQNMWGYLKDSYKLQNALWKGSDLQSKLPKEFKGAYKKGVFQELLTKYTRKAAKQHKVVGIQKTVQVQKEEGVAYFRKGKAVKSYARSSPKEFKQDEIDFLTRRINQPARQVYQMFNDVFSTGRTFESIRTKLMRLKK